VLMCQTPFAIFYEIKTKIISGKRVSCGSFSSLKGIPSGLYSFNRTITSFITSGRMHPEDHHPKTKILSIYKHSLLDYGPQGSHGS
jgi:hypothetical protein